MPQAEETPWNLPWEIHEGSIQTITGDIVAMSVHSSCVRQIMELKCLCEIIQDDLEDEDPIEYLHRLHVSRMEVEEEYAGKQV